MRRRVLLALLATAALAASASAATKFSLTSSAFKNGGSYPNVFSCIGANETPPLAWTAPPKVRDKRTQKLVDPTKSFAIVLDDPDAPGGTFTHWITWNISPKKRSLSQNERGPEEGANDSGEGGFFGACAPPGDPPHRYVFTLYALKAKLTLPPGAERPAFDAAIRGKVHAKTTLTGLFGR